MKQIHSAIVHFPDAVAEGETTEGDGIILDRPGLLGVIKTADCTPLFFVNDSGTVGGVLHVGWQGLLGDIQLKVPALLRPFNPGHLNFFMGPAIEQECYEVGRDLYDRFEGKIYRDAVFAPFEKNTVDLTRENSSGVQKGTQKGTGTSIGISNVKYKMDVQMGIRLSLQAAGIDEGRIVNSGICNFCRKDRFPSYRRQAGTGERILSFMMLLE